MNMMDVIIKFLTIPLVMALIAKNAVKKYLSK